MKNRQLTALVYTGITLGSLVGVTAVAQKSGVAHGNASSHFIESVEWDKLEAELESEAPVDEADAGDEKSAPNLEMAQDNNES